MYRTLQMFKKIGLVQNISLDDACMRYYLSDLEEKQHHHLICEICGEIIDIQEDVIQLFEEKLLNEKGFTVTHYKAKVFGICNKCQEFLKKQ